MNSILLVYLMKASRLHYMGRYAVRALNLVSHYSVVETRQSDGIDRDVERIVYSCAILAEI